jgi:hypothetical protein
MAMVISEAVARGKIVSRPLEYIAAFGIFVPKDNSQNLWDMFTNEQKAVYIKWFFNETRKLEDLEEEGLLTFLRSRSDSDTAVFLNRFPDKQYNPRISDSDNDTAMSALNVFKKASEKSFGGGGSRRKRQRTRKYKKSKRIFRSKNRQTRRR